MKKWIFTINEFPKKEDRYLCYVFYADNNDPYFSIEIVEFGYHEEYVRLNDQETMIKKSKSLSFLNWGNVHAWMNLPEKPNEKELWQ